MQVWVEVLSNRVNVHRVKGEPFAWTFTASDRLLKAFEFIEYRKFEIVDPPEIELPLSLAEIVDPPEIELPLSLADAPPPVHFRTRGRDAAECGSEDGPYTGRAGSATCSDCMSGIRRVLSRPTPSRAAAREREGLDSALRSLADAVEVARAALSAPETAGRALPRAQWGPGVETRP
jgi:hypothetical protein